MARGATTKIILDMFELILKLVPGVSDQIERKYLISANKYSVEKDPYKREQEKKDDRKFKKRFT